MSLTETNPTPKRRQFTGYHMILVMVAFFGTIITVNMIMAWHATHSWTGLVVKSSYVASQHFNEVTAQKQAHAAMGWQTAIDYQDQQLTVTVTDNTGSVIENAIVTAALGRPAHEQLDRTLQFAETNAGTYTVSEVLEPGLWQADFTVTDAKGVIWTKSYRFITKDEAGTDQ